MSARQDPRRPLDPRDDSGFTLVELMTAMALFSVLVVIFLGALVGLTGTVNTVSASAHGASTNQTIISTIGRQVPYADAINRPVAVSGVRYIELRIPRSSTGTNQIGCVQWRYNPTTEIVQMRRWGLDAASGVVGLTSWSTKGTGIIDQGGVGYPFSMVPADNGAGLQRQQFAIRLTTGNDVGDSSTSNTSFVARNSSFSSETNTDANSDGVSDNQICQQAGRS